jgi:hypothetical protein
MAGQEDTKMMMWRMEMGSTAPKAFGAVAIGALADGIFGQHVRRVDCACVSEFGAGAHRTAPEAGALPNLSSLWD